MNDIFTTTFEKHKKLLLESLNDYNWEEKVDWSVFDTTEDNSGAFEKLLGISEAKNPQSVTPTTPPSLTIVSVPTGDWWELYNNLPEPIKRTAIERYKLFLKDSKENGFKIVWIFVGNHNQYDAFKNSLPTS